VVDGVVKFAGNYHVVTSSSTFEFNGKRIQIPKKELWIKSDHHFDLAFCNAKIVNGMKPIHIATISKRGDELRQATFVTFDINKPDIELSVGSCQFSLSETDGEIRHNMSTENGSCGSMILNPSGDLIAIHYADLERGVRNRSDRPNGAILISPLK
jgi:hypothetical protein